MLVLFELWFTLVFAVGLIWVCFVVRLLTCLFLLVAYCFGLQLLFGVCGV